MRLHEISKAILTLLYHSRGKKLTEKGIQTELKLLKHDRKKLLKCLQRLEGRGEIARDKSGAYSLGDPDRVVTGRVRVTRSGNGIVILPDGTSLVVERRHMVNALHGDEVTVQLDQRTKSRDDGRRTGRIVGIMSRGSVEVVGVLRGYEGEFEVVANDPRYPRPFSVPGDGGAKQGDRVVVRLEEWSDPRQDPTGEIIEVIGPASDPSLDTLSILRQYNLTIDFPTEVMEQAERASLATGLDDSEREDIRDLLTITIDPERARDFDDALSLQTDTSGRAVLGVHIADVAHFVPQGSPLDEEAYRRGNSVYLPDMVIPMLPEQLSNGICSLRPEVERLAFSAFITFNEAGEQVASRFAKTIIRSDLRLTYEEALEGLEANAGALRADHPASREQQSLLHRLWALAGRLRNRRFKLHALDIDLPECEISMGKHGLIDEVELVANDISHQLVEECMVSANEAVDRALSRARLPLIHRLHEPPKTERIEKLTADLVGMGYEPGDLNHRANLSAFLASVRDDPMAHHIRMAVLRSMNRALYSTEAGGHYGLSKDHYTHFTSPIRRYADLVIHRQLVCMLSKTPPAYQEGRLSEICAHCSSTEETAERAERDLVEVKKLRYLKQQLKGRKPEAYDGVVVHVLGVGFIVEILELQLEGLVPREAVKSRSGSRGRHRDRLPTGLELGQRMRVYVTQVDMDTRRIKLGVESNSIGRRPSEGGKGPSAKSTRRKGGGDKSTSGRGKSKGKGKGKGGGPSESGHGKGEGTSSKKRSGGKRRRR